MSTPSAAPPVDKDSEIDVEWERFAQNGCPDWWLMAKYTSGWLSRSLPYMAFKGTHSGSTTARTQSTSGVEPQQAADAAAAVGTAEAATSRLARSQSLDRQQLLGAPEVAPAASLPPAPATAAEPPSLIDHAANDRDVAARSATSAGPVTTAAASPAQTASAHAATPAAGPVVHTPGCAPSKASLLASAPQWPTRTGLWIRQPLDCQQGSSIFQTDVLAAPMDVLQLSSLLS